MGVDWLAPDWPAPASVRALSTMRGGGVSLPPYGSLNLGDHVGDEPAAVAQNRSRLRTAAKVPAEPAWLAQVHGVDVRDLDGNAPGPDRADAAVTREPGCVCAILTADCLPVLLAADSGDAVGAAHAGWRGLCAGVIEATVRSLDVHRNRSWHGSVPGSVPCTSRSETRCAKRWCGRIRARRRHSSQTPEGGSWRICRRSRGAGSNTSASSGYTGAGCARSGIPAAIFRIGGTAGRGGRERSSGSRRKVRKLGSSR